MKWFTRKQRTSQRFSSAESQRPKFRTWKPTIDVLEERLAPAGVWNDLAPTNPALFGANGGQAMMLLSDGSIAVQQGNDTASTTWFRLVPNAAGSYLNGTWTAMGSMNVGRLFATSLMLQDGRVFMVGGEYSTPFDFTNTAEIFNPLTNAWGNVASVPTPLTQVGANPPPVPTSQFGDDPIVLLSNGKILAGYFNDGTTYLYDPATNTWTTTAGSKLRGDRSDEETWVKLPDGSILSYDIFSSISTGVFHAQRYIPSTDTWVDASNVNPGSPPGLLSSANEGFELGPALRIPVGAGAHGGQVLFFGTNGNTAYYNPATDTWSAGPAEPNIAAVQWVATDDPGAVLPNGKILVALSPQGTLNASGAYTFPATSKIFELDTNTGVYTDVTPAAGIAPNAFRLNMLVLPSGEVLLDNSAGGGAQSFKIYTPDLAPQDFWRPVINSISNNLDGTFTLKGTQLTGLDEGSSYGDDWSNSSNYPVLRLRTAGGFVYARTFNWDSTDIATGNTPQSVTFTLPAGVTLPQVLGFTVVANGIPSFEASDLILGPALENVVFRLDPNNSNIIQILNAAYVPVGAILNNQPGTFNVFGDLNPNFVIIDNSFGNVNTPIAFDGGFSLGLPGDRMIIIGSNGDDNLNIFNEAIRAGRTSFNGSALMSFQNIDQFIFNAAGGNDGMTVDSSFTLLNLIFGVHYDGGAGFNTLTLAQTGGDVQTTETYSVGPANGQGSDAIQGPSGFQQVFFENLAPVFSFVPATTLIINATSANNAINYQSSTIFGPTWGQVTIDNFESHHFRNKTNLVINAGAGSDTINLNNPNRPIGLTGTITVNGNDPTASDTLVVNGIAGVTDDMIVNPTATGAGGVTDAPAATFVNVSYTGIEHLSMVGQSADNDGLRLGGTSGDDTVFVTPGATRDAGSATGFTTNGGAGGTPFAFVPVDFSGFLGFIVAASAAIQAGGSDSVVIDGSAADDVFNFSNGTVAGLIGPSVTVTTGSNNTHAQIYLGSSVTGMLLRGLTGNDVFNINLNPVPGFNTVAVRVEGGDSDALTDVLNYIATPGAATNVNVGTSTITQTGPAGNPVVYNGIERINMSMSGAASTLTVVGTSGDDTFDFTPSAAGAGSFKVAWVGAATGASPLFTYSGLGNGITTDGGAGGFDTLGLIATTGNDNISAVQAAAGTLAYTQNAFTVNFTITSMEASRIDALAGDDVIFVNVADLLNAASLRFTVNGGEPGGSDRLIVNDAGLGDLVIIHDGFDRTSGTVTVGALNPVVYNGVERVDITPVNNVTGGTGTDGAGRIKVFHTDAWENNDTRLFAGLVDRLSGNPTGPNIFPGSLANPVVGGDEDWFEFRPQKTSTFKVKIIFDRIVALANGRAGLPGTGDLDLQVFDANGNLIATGVADPGGNNRTVLFGATNDPAFPQFNRIFIRVRGASAASINVYDFEGLGVVADADTQGPQVTGVQLTDFPDFNLFGLKPENAFQGPTPLVNSITISFQDLPPRAAGFLYPALDPVSASTPGTYVVRGDRVGNVAIAQIIVTNDPVVAGLPATATVQLVFAQPLPDDRFTLIVNDNLTDPVGNKLDGESNAAEPNGAPIFPSGDGHVGGDFIARFTVDSRPEIGTYAGGSISVDLNGNFVVNPNVNAATDTTGDVTYKYSVNGAAVFAGQFTSDGVKADGFGNNFFDRVGLYGRYKGKLTWMLDVDDNGIIIGNVPGVGPSPDIIRTSGLQINGLPIAGNFNYNADDGQEIGLFDGKTWYLDTLAQNNITSLSTKFTGNMRGLPVIGDFDGDGNFDLATFQNNTFFFDLSTVGGSVGGLVGINGNADVAVNFGAFPKTARPVAADMDGDGITDIGLFVPRTKNAEWFFAVTNQPGGTVFVFDREPGVDFATDPFQNDFSATYGSAKSLPIVGNFDPPANVKAAQAAAKAWKAQHSGLDGSTIKALQHDLYFANNGWRHNYAS